jgi:hypothetical protein
VPHPPGGVVHFEHSIDVEALDYVEEVEQATG